MFGHHIFDDHVLRFAGHLSPEELSTIPKVLAVVAEKIVMRVVYFDRVNFYIPTRRNRLVRIGSESANEYTIDRPADMKSTILRVKRIIERCGFDKFKIMYPTETKPEEEEVNLYATWHQGKFFYHNPVRVSLYQPKINSLLQLAKKFDVFHYGISGLELSHDSLCWKQEEAESLHDAFMKSAYFSRLRGQSGTFIGPDGSRTEYYGYTPGTSKTATNPNVYACSYTGKPFRFRNEHSPQFCLHYEIRLSHLSNLRNTYKISNLYDLLNMDTQSVFGRIINFYDTDNDIFRRWVESLSRKFPDHCEIEPVKLQRYLNLVSELGTRPDRVKSKIRKSISPFIL